MSRPEHDGTTAGSDGGRRADRKDERRSRSTGCEARSAGADRTSGRDTQGRWVGQPDEERFWALVEVTAGCWLWLGRATPDRYGLFDVRIDGRWRPVRAHRWAWEAAHGPLGPGLTLDHLIGPGEPCTSTLCVRPDHLDPVTTSENLRRRHARARAREGR